MINSNYFIFDNEKRKVIYETDYSEELIRKAKEMSKTIDKEKQKTYSVVNEKKDKVVDLYFFVTHYCW